MIEQGIVLLLQQNPAIAGISLGGWAEELPSNSTLPSWAYTTVHKDPLYSLVAQPGLFRWIVQFDCFSGTDQGTQGGQYSGPTSLDIAMAIYNVLSGFKGTLPDPQATGVDSAFLIDWDGPRFDSARRTFRTMLEFRIWYFWSPPVQPSV